MKNITFSFFILLLSSCGTFTKPIEHKYDKTMVSAQSFDNTWSKVIKFFSSKNIPIKNIEKSSGLIVSDSFTINTLADADKFDCGKYSMPNAIGNKFNGKASFNVFVEKNNNMSTAITVNAVGEIDHYEENLKHRFQYKCFSTGVFEISLFEYIQK